MGRLWHIGWIAFLGIGFILCTYFMYRAFKNTTVNGKRLMDEPVNKSTRKDKMRIGEILIYILMLIIAIIFAIQIAYRGAKFPSATSILIKTVILVPIMALFNARKRTGKALVALFASLLFVVFCTMTYMIIGLPEKAPVLTINSTEIRLGQTTVRELMDDGFDIYIEKEHTTLSDYEDFPDSEQFEKCSEKIDIYIPKGYHRYSAKSIPYSKGVLAKNNIPIANVRFYGSMTKKTPFKDCSIIYFDMREKFVPKIKKDNISIKLNGINLFSKLENETMKKTFGRKILRPDQMETDKHLIISWSSNSEHLFFNSYAAIIYVGDNYLMNAMELECQIAREAD